MVERLFDAIVILGLVLLNLRQLTGMPPPRSGRSIQKGAVIGSAVFLLLCLSSLQWCSFRAYPKGQRLGYQPRCARSSARAPERIVARFITDYPACAHQLKRLKCCCSPSPSGPVRPACIGA